MTGIIKEQKGAAGEDIKDQIRVVLKNYSRESLGKAIVEFFSWKRSKLVTGV